MKRTLLIAVIAGIVIGLSIVAGTFLPKVLAPSAPTNGTQAFSDPQLGLRLRYPKGMTASSLSDDDRKTKIALRLNQEKPPALVTVRSESGLRIVGATSKQSIVDVLVRNVARTYPARYPGYKEVSNRRLTVSGRPAAEIVFTYTGTTGEVAKQKLLIISRDDDVAVFVAAQAREADFDTVNKAGFEPIMNSVKL